jgi:Dolichyl-phosphate-mannose-protein mannosyltransferase
MRSALTLAAVAALLVLFLALGGIFIDANSQTFDEAAHLAAGYSYWATGDFRLNTEHPPLLKLLWALPIYLFEHVPFQPDPNLWQRADAWQIGRTLLYESPVPFQRLLTLARWVNLGLGAMLIALVGWWAYRLWGRGAAVVAVALAAFDPTLLALSCILSTDLGLTLFTFATCYCLWEYDRKPSGARLAGVGVCLGLALGSKFSAVFVVAILAMILLAHLAAGGGVAMPGAKRPEPSDSFDVRLRAAAPVVARVALIAMLTLLPPYFFVHFAEWGGGLKQQFMRNAFDPPQFYFLGEVSSQGWLAYFPVAFILKTPLGTLGLLAVSLVGWKWGARIRRREVLFLLGPAALFFLAMMVTRVNIGVRVILPVYPFVLVLAARVATFGREGRLEQPLPRPLPEAGRGENRNEQLSNPEGQPTLNTPFPLREGCRGVRLMLVASGSLVSLCLAATAWSSLRSTPHQLAYFNETIGGPEQGHRYLGDSNLDWGQDLFALKQFVDREGVPIIYLSYAGTAPPAKYGLRYQFLPGWGQLETPPDDKVPADAPRHLLAISVSNLQGTYLEDKQMYRWLLDRHPLATLGHAIWVFDLTGDVEALQRLSAISANP